jgi:hypothetical protein
MPINEILAPFYAIVKYTTAARPQGHNLRLYFDAIPTYEADETVFGTYTDAGHTEGWSLQSIVDEFLSRWVAQSPNGVVTVSEVSMWESEDGVNTFKGLDPDDYSGSAHGSGVGIASAYSMYVFKAADRSQMRYTLFEAADAKPQRFPLSAPPATDDDSLEWFVVRSAVNFVTNDNKPITIAASGNTGYNRKLARSYGRAITP